MTYECDFCGACCRALIIEIGELDIAREPKLIQLGAKAFKKWEEQVYDYTDEDTEEDLGPLVPGYEAGAMLASGADYSCPAIGADNRCTIYPTRPNACVAFRAGSGQCQSAREAKGIAPLQPKGANAR